MRVKGGGRRKSWDAMPVDDGALLFQDTEPNDLAFAVPEHQPSVTEPEAQIEPESENQEQVVEEGNDGDGEGEDGGGDGEEGEEGEGEAEVEAEDENKERSTKLDEGFYEIEAIRRKRVRKGQLQYLIKWRGWPETANTWEPLENLQSVSDVIDAFEESLRTGKQRKRKRKSGTPHTQPKKKQQQQQQRSTDTIYTVTDGEVSNGDKALSSLALNGSGADGLPPPQQSFHTVGDGENNGPLKNTDTASTIDSGNFYANASHQISERREENEYDPKLSELKASVSTNIVSSDKLSVHFQEPKALEVNGPANGLSKVDCGEPVQGSRSTGAKRRKSGSVKRFKQEAPSATQNVPTRVSTRYAGRVDQTGVENFDYAGENSGRKNKIDQCKEAVRITKILKPMGYSTSISNNVQDVSVTFMAMRSDGSEVIVDNKFLKVNDPLLLINFYEAHLRYSPAV